MPVEVGNAEAPMTTVGIDLSVSNRRTAIATIDWAAGRGRASRPIVDPEESELERYVAEGDRVGISAPFGWPEGMVESIYSYATSSTWQPVEKEEFRFRRTDRLAREHLTVETGRRLWFLSPSSDRIALTAWRLATLRERVFERSGKRFDLSGSDGIFEVYPAAALLLWGFEGVGYKAGQESDRQETARTAREGLVSAIEVAAPWLEWQGDARQACVGSADALDAVICSLLARANALALTIDPPAEELDHARREGWIHLPYRESLSRLATGNVSAGSALPSPAPVPPPPAAPSPPPGVAVASTPNSAFGAVPAQPAKEERSEQVAVPEGRVVTSPASPLSS